MRDLEEWIRQSLLGRTLCCALSGLKTSLSHSQGVALGYVIAGLWPAERSITSFEEMWVKINLLHCYYVGKTASLLHLRHRDADLRGRFVHVAQGGRLGFAAFIAQISAHGVEP